MLVGLRVAETPLSPFSACLFSFSFQGTNHVQEALAIMNRLTPAVCTWHRLPACGAVPTVEAPAAMVYPSQLFLAPLGYRHE